MSIDRNICQSAVENIVVYLKTAYIFVIFSLLSIPKYKNRLSELRSVSIRIMSAIRVRVRPCACNKFIIDIIIDIIFKLYYIIYCYIAYYGARTSRGRRMIACRTYNNRDKTFKVKKAYPEG